MRADRIGLTLAAPLLEARDRPLAWATATSSPRVSDSLAAAFSLSASSSLSVNRVVTVVECRPPDLRDFTRPARETPH